MASQATHQIRTLVSSVGGFSRPEESDIRTLEDLLRWIQPLGLELYDGSSLRGKSAVGEGASYKVFRCTDAKKHEIVAVKQVKLPDDTSQSEALQERVDCVLKDLEVMHHPPLARHENILTLLGYGWGLAKGDIIPFLVTEYAALGTLRECLLSRPLPTESKLGLCNQIACGLNRLHWSGVAHGDLKLENILVFQSSRPNNGGEYGTDLIAKLPSLSSVTTTNTTPRYLAPELQGSAEKLGKVEFLRCDVWALGLLCWEVLWNGCRYYEIDCIQGLSRKSSRNCSSGDNLSASCELKTSMNDDSFRERMFALCPDLARLAQLSVDLLLGHPYCSLRRNMVKGILRNTLQVNPQLRPHDLSRLPFIFGGGLYAGYAIGILPKFLQASNYLDGPTQTIWNVPLSKGHLLKRNGFMRFVPT
ncbi:hypothetical protein GP486_001782 [Trichoglossum hirsutum]|uniref:Protein kinase domain-containing protein n=1 Tax=Trichoglossum hirsutum TaxID=265104 RepID=A0A9P8LGG7_9PEZI|nr:hypothetical protein GP486_001782 [Trichoglossum hirsutum]